ncbi:MAG: hypothetical protein U5L07_00075 [Desulfobacterales bacterium]|nr:hypothetical protein [Desulfobacterales bacterium]
MAPTPSITGREKAAKRNVAAVSRSVLVLWLKKMCQYKNMVFYMAFLIHNRLLTGWRLGALPLLKQIALVLLGWAKPLAPASPGQQQGSAKSIRVYQRL